ncbi:MAG: hypothetical protein ACTSVI_00880 [Promethearchaeota archaeon]
MKYLSSLVNNRKKKIQLVEISIFLSLAAMCFYIFNTNMLMFGIFIYAGFAWIFFTTKEKKIPALIGILGGTIGAFTEAWGCLNHYWNWEEPCITIWMIGGHPSGFPFEVVFAYFAAGFWIGKITGVLFPELIEYKKKYASMKNTRIKEKIHYSISLLVSLLAFTIIVIEPAWLQSLILLATGVILVIFLPRRVTLGILPFSLFMGISGFFFENFATGILPGFSVWTYNIPLYSTLKIAIPIVGVAPISAFIAYFGCGMILFSLVFHLNKKMHAA